MIDQLDAKELAVLLARASLKRQLQAKGYKLWQLDGAAIRREAIVRAPEFEELAHTAIGYFNWRLRHERPQG